MKKIFLIPLLILGSVLMADAQKYLELYAGPSLPISDYGKKGNGGPGSFAETGQTVGLHYGRLLMEHAGIGAEIAYSSHSVDGAQAADAFGIQEFRQDAYTNIFGGVGVVFDFPLTEKLTLNIKSMLGVLSVSMAEREFVYSDTLTVVTESQSAISLTFKVGFGLRYHVSDHFSLSFATDLTDANPKFDEGDLQNVRRNFNYIDPRIGIVYYFGAERERPYR